MLIVVGSFLGIGMAGLFVPSLRQVEASTPAASRARMIGFAAAGTSVGTLLLPPIVISTVPHLGVGPIFTVLAFVTACGTVFAAWAAGPRLESPTVPLIVKVDRRLQLVGVCAGMAYYLPLSHLVAAAGDTGMSQGVAALLLTTMGLSNLVGRLGMGRVYTPRLGRVWLAASLCGLAVALLLFAKVEAIHATIALVAVIYGVSSGALVVCLPTKALEDSVGSPGAVIGTVYRSLCWGAIAGPVAAGWWFDRTSGYGAASVAIGAVALAGSLVALRGGRRVVLNPSGPGIA